MKKATLFVAVAALSVGTLVSCGKSTKGKMDGEWSIDSMSTTSTDTDQSGTSTVVVTIDGTTRTWTSTDQNGNSTTQTTTVNSAVWNIKKDGTWESELSYTLTGSNSTQSSTTKASGNWDFTTGVGDFKKNERVVFNTLSKTVTSSSTTGSVTSSSTGTETYLDGEDSKIYVITESKKKSLQMEYKGSNTYTSGNNTSTSAVSSTVKLTLK